MSLDNIQLPPWVITHLYRNTLVKPIDRSDKAHQGAGSALRFLGNNRKHIGLLVNEASAVFLPDLQLEFITKMLEACKLNLADVALLNLSGTNLTLTQIKMELRPEILFLFGPEPEFLELPFIIPPFKIQSHEECRYVYLPTLGQILSGSEESKLLKTKLWACLKLLFGLK